MMNEEISMNLDDRITQDTVLFGYIAVSASKNRLGHNFNALLKQRGINGMMVPMNIREDDFYFTLSNMKKSHLNGAILSLEYQEDVLELLDTSSEMVKMCGGCDFVLRAGETLQGDFLAPHVVKDFIDSNEAVKKIAVIGDFALARGLALVLKDYDISFYDTEIEKLLLMSQAVDVKIDINYLSPNGVDFSEYDILIDTTREDITSYIAKGARINLDLKDSSSFSSLKGMQGYIGFEDLMDLYSKQLLTKGVA